jgi:hypothetical protein
MTACVVCNFELPDDKATPALCDVHLQEAWMNFMLGDDAEMEPV